MQRRGKSNVCSARLVVGGGGGGGGGGALAELEVRARLQALGIRQVRGLAHILALGGNGKDGRRDGVPVNGGRVVESPVVARRQLGVAAAGKATAAARGAGGWKGRAGAAERCGPAAAAARKKTRPRGGGSVRQQSVIQPTHPSQYSHGRSVPTSAYQLLDSPPCFCQCAQTRPPMVALPRYTDLPRRSQSGCTMPQ